MELENIRLDGRFYPELRNINISHGYENNNGFIILSHGNTSIKATSKKSDGKSKLKINIKFSEISRNEPINDRRLYELEYKIENIFTPLLLSESCYEIELFIIQDDGSLFPALINATTLLMAYCGIPFKDLCFAVCLNERIDLCYLEENKSYNSIVSILFKSNKINYFETYGKVQKRSIFENLENGKIACQNIGEIFKKYLNEWDSPFKMGDYQ